MTTTFPSIPLGASIPSFTPHAISVSLPTWRDNVGYEEGEKRVVDAMVSGYPRFFIHFSIQKLEHICESKFGTPSERCMLFPSKAIAESCRAFILHRSETPPTVHLVQFLIRPEDNEKNGEFTNVHTRQPSQTRPLSKAPMSLHIVLFPKDTFPVAKQFWQHSGLGISSRLADHCLTMLPDDKPTSPPSPIVNRPVKILNKHYNKHSIKPVSPKSDHFTPPAAPESDQETYLEERYGRNLPISFASSAKRALRRRIAGVLVRDTFEDCQDGPYAGKADLEVGSSSRGVKSVKEDDVYLFPTGMAAIWSAHQMCLATMPSAKSVMFGFPYTDTLKILQKWGPGCHFLGHGLDADIDQLQGIIQDALTTTPNQPPILALFTEFPSNPLLRSADLPRLRALADQHEFLIVVDETLGNFVNVDVLPHADIVVSSLSKIFSGDANVMGGSLVLNPAGKHYPALKAHFTDHFEDVFFDEDSIYMERNSRDFRKRVHIIDVNTEAVCDLLRSRSLAGGSTSPKTVIKDVIYPKWTTRTHFEQCRIKDRDPDGGFGGLFSVLFTSLSASRAFYDALPCAKGPSLGTNFTLASPYTVLAHYTEMEWAAEYGVEEGLVRISVGMEERGVLLKDFEDALKAAEVAVEG